MLDKVVKFVFWTVIAVIAMFFAVEILFAITGLGISVVVTGLVFLVKFWWVLAIILLGYLLYKLSE